MQALWDFLPLLAFFVTYRQAGIYPATAVLAVAVTLQVALQWLRHRKVNPMHLVSAALVLVFGGLTLLIGDKSFIQWKPTILAWLLAGILLGSQVVGERPAIERLLSSSLRLEPGDWRRLNAAWAVFFLAEGALNLFVARRYDEATWVNFKVFGLLGLTLVFAVAQGLWLAGRVQEEPPAGGGAGAAEPTAEAGAE